MKDKENCDDAKTFHWQYNILRLLPIAFWLADEFTIYLSSFVCLEYTKKDGGCKDNGSCVPFLSVPPWVNAVTSPL